jgi:8-amino-7-oxononanoate synthase
VIDFTSALYLGMHHGSGTIGPWERFTTGVPAVLGPPPHERSLTDALARLQGCERAALSSSTLHLFWDFFGTWATRGTTIFFDAGLYAIGRWGIERSAGRGVPVRSFPHHDASALRELLQRHAHARQWPTVVTDGFCTGCGRHAPVRDYFELAQEFGGRLIMDDTQAIGIFGLAYSALAPYGKGGGGTLRRFNLSGPSVLSVSSLAKGFGVPVAVLAGSRETIADFEQASDTRVHCSPPSIPVLHAARHALALNNKYGDGLRLCLAQRVSHFRKRLAEVGISATGGLFPVQTLKEISGECARTLHDQLSRLGIRTVLHCGHGKNGLSLSFTLTARHRVTEIDRAVKMLDCVLRSQERRSNRIPELNLNKLLVRERDNHEIRR